MIEIRNLTKCFNCIKLFDNFNISIKENHISCFFGSSGVGKTTLSRMIAGLDNDFTGSINTAKETKISYVFQETRLLDWLSVYDNIDLVLQNLYSKKEREIIIDEYLSIVNLKDFKDNKVSTLSGGMAQRVSLARAFAYPSDILIMDEPFKGLDMVISEQLINTFKLLWKKNKRTVIFITHNLDEAMEISDEIFILSGSPVNIVDSFTKNNFNTITKSKIKELITND